ncbi:MAG: hypothetical protein IKV97_06940 [Clostridia bacterium]|nr:hypothetical protein [Clostridia bacterium]
MRKYLLPENCNTYKANLHSHSTWSDGCHSPEEMKKVYKEHGYSILSITDHNGLFSHYDLNEDDFLALTGYEVDFNRVHGNDYADFETAHFCAYPRERDNFTQPGLDMEYRSEKMRWTVNEETRKLLRPDGKAFSKSYDPENVNACLKILRDKNFIVTYNHPCWSVEDYSNYMSYDEIDCMEVYNHGCYVAGWDEYNGRMYDDILRSGKIIKCVATDDNHGTHDTCGGFTMFFAKKLCHEDIINAFDNGDFYCSTGPEITALYMEDGKLHIETKEKYEEIRLVTGHRRASRVCGEDHACFAVHPSCKYVRLEVVHGSKRAYTNAYPVSVLLGE